MTKEIQRHDNKAVTLIDLTVAIAIIGSLSLVLYPAFAYSKDGANAKSCLSNLKRIGEAVVMYADDNNQALVPTIRERDGSKEVYLANYRTWRALLYKYVKGEAAYVCPAVPSEAVMWRGRYDIEYSEIVIPTNDVPSNFAINNKVCSNDSFAQGQYTHNKSEYRNPAGLILATEVKNGIWNTNDSIMDRTAIATYAPFHHQNRLGVLFLDGHAKIMYLWDTIGSAPDEWMWWDPVANASYGGVSTIAATQLRYKSTWPKSYPKP